ncbi:hypothetical protein ACJX0J_010255, partial [Zea mays]
ATLVQISVSIQARGIRWKSAFLESQDALGHSRTRSCSPFAHTLGFSSPLSLPRLLSPSSSSRPRALTPPAPLAPELSLPRLLSPSSSRTLDSPRSLSPPSPLALELSLPVSSRPRALPPPSPIALELSHPPLPSLLRIWFVQVSSKAMADMVSGVGSQGARPALRWSAAMSRFVLRRFVDLIGTGVRTDKGFKEIHLNSVAKNVSEFCGQEVTGQQVYNHLRKWRSRWVKVCKLKDISGALWDEDTFVISLEEGHYAAYIKNYMAMQIIFGSGMMALKYMTDEDVAVFNGMKEVVSDVQCLLSDVINFTELFFQIWFCWLQQVWSLFAILYATRFTVYMFTFAVYIFDVLIKKFHFHVLKFLILQVLLDGLYLQVVCIYKCLCHTDINLDAGLINNRGKKVLFLGFSTRRVTVKNESYFGTDERELLFFFLFPFFLHQRSISIGGLEDVYLQPILSLSQILGPLLDSGFINDSGFCYFLFIPVCTGATIQ